MPRCLGPVTATLVVVANMIGTGVFTTTGLLLTDIESPSAVLLAWLLGGVIALAGALCYSELGTSIARNGGEYRFLTELIHPAVGFAAGWISLVVGFSAPIAASALAFGIYVHVLFPGVPPLASGLVLVALLSALHGTRVETGTRIQNGLTVLKILLIVGFVAAAIFVIPSHSLVRLSGFGPEVFSAPFAVMVVSVSFAYSGWNGAAYLVGEMRRPGKHLPIALGLGTAVVTLLYLGFNAVVLLGTPIGKLVGTIDVGYVATVGLFGEKAGLLLSLLIALVLMSSESAMIMVGARVYEAMGEDYPALRLLRLRRRGGGPVFAIALQGLLAAGLLLTLTFQALLVYIGLTLSVFAGLTVVALFLHRRRCPCDDGGNRVWGYPVTPLVFLGFTGWWVVRCIVERPIEAILSGLTVAVGLALYAGVKRLGVPPACKET